MDRELLRNDTQEVRDEQQLITEVPRPENPGDACVNARSRSSYLQEYEITLKFLNAGGIIVIGCKKIAFSSIEELKRELLEYIEDPGKSREKWFNIFKSLE